MLDSRHPAPRRDVRGPSCVPPRASDSAVTSTPVRTSDTSWSLDALLSSAGTNAQLIGDPRAVRCREPRLSLGRRPAGRPVLLRPRQPATGTRSRPRRWDAGRPPGRGANGGCAGAPPRCVVRSVRQAMGPISAAFFGRPSERMTLVGITGTNGKTTTTYLLESVFRAAGLVPGVIGTTGVRIAGGRSPSTAPRLRRRTSSACWPGWRRPGSGPWPWRCPRMAWTSIGSTGSGSRCAVFTNLSQDHLDYHPTMEAYFAAKARLFTPELSRTAARNVDSPEGRVRPASAGRSDVPVLDVRAGTEAGLRATDVGSPQPGSPSRVDGPRGSRRRLIGGFNVSNCLAAMAAARRWASTTPRSPRASAALAGVPGRLEPVDAGQPFAVLVDYAHSPDSLDIVLAHGPPADRRAGDRRVRVRRRPRPGEASADGRGRDAPCRPGRAHQRQPAVRGPRRDHRARSCPGRRRGGGAFVVEPDRRAAIRLAVSRGAVRATWSSSRARATSRARSSPTGRCRSTTGTWPVGSSSPSSRSGHDPGHARRRRRGSRGIAAPRSERGRARSDARRVGGGRGQPGDPSGRPVLRAAGRAHRRPPFRGPGAGRRGGRRRGAARLARGPRPEDRGPRPGPGADRPGSVGKGPDGCDRGRRHRFHREDVHEGPHRRRPGHRPAGHGQPGVVQQRDRAAPDVAAADERTEVRGLRDGGPGAGPHPAAEPRWPGRTWAW